VNVNTILARIGTEHPPTYTEMGFLLPELERRKILIADTPQFCCGKRIACFYRFRDQQFLWACAHHGYGQEGKIKVPAAAILTAPLPIGVAIITWCRRCGDSFFLVVEPDRTVNIHRQQPPIWTQVV